MGACAVCCKLQPERPDSSMALYPHQFQGDPSESSVSGLASRSTGKYTNGCFLDVCTLSDHIAASIAMMLKHKVTKNYNS